MSTVSPRVLPGFGLGMGTSLVWLAGLVLIPLAACLARALELSPAEFVAAAFSDRALAAYGLTFGVSVLAALINVILGLVVAWTLARYDFPLKRLADALVDVPLALPTAVAGLVFASLFMGNGWYGRFLLPMGIEVSYTRLGILLVLVFTGFPFVVRAVQPVLATLEDEIEEAASLLGASRWQTFRRVLLPLLIPPALTGFALSFARSLGEYGSVIFISSNKPMETEIAPMLIVSRLEAFAYREAAAIASVLLVASFVLLVAINRLERWSNRHVA